MKLIPLTQGQFAKVDDEDFERVNQFKWFAHKGKNTPFRAQRNEYKDGKQKTILMHRFILNAEDGVFVDHEDRVPLNNQKSNLRKCTNAENCRNKTYPSKQKYKGVHKKPGYKNFLAQILVKGKKLHLGMFELEEDAAKAYDASAKEHFGEFANLNFK